VLVAGEETNESLSTCTWLRAAAAHQSSESERGPRETDRTSREEECSGRKGNAQVASTARRKKKTRGLSCGPVFFPHSFFELFIYLFIYLFIFLSLPFNLIFYSRRFYIYSLHWTLSMASTIFVLNNRNNNFLKSNGRSSAFQLRRIELI
jgi:hypothetical protein